MKPRWYAGYLSGIWLATALGRSLPIWSDRVFHSSIETTRIYLISTGAEHARQLERLGHIS